MRVGKKETGTRHWSPARQRKQQVLIHLKRGESVTCLGSRRRRSGESRSWRVISLGWVCCVHHATELGFHPGGAGNHTRVLSTRATQQMGVSESTSGSGLDRVGVRQEGSARRREPPEAAISRRKNNGPKAVMQGMAISCR